MKNDLKPCLDSCPQKPWWREREVAILVVLVAVAYFVRMGEVTLRGEEHRRAQVSQEMLENGDWIVPREQGEPFLSRPPLQNWLIAASCVVCGSRETWVIRLHSVLAMLFTTILIYGYARTCISRLGALAAALAFPTIGEMFEIGYQAETEMLFIFLLSASLILWHWGQVRGWPQTRTWIIGYSLVALAILCKGPQPPVYFLSAVCAYLVLTGQARRLFSFAHLAGALVGAAIVLAWAIPCAMLTSWPQMKAIILNDTTSRFENWTVLHVASHMLRFPLEDLGCTMPWSLLLFAFVRRDVRRLLDKTRPQALFMGLCLILSFPTCWIPPGGQTRYLAPLYPCLAVLVGMVVEFCAAGNIPISLRNGWRRYLQFFAWIMVVLGVAVVLASILLPGHAKFAPWAEGLPIALGYAAASMVLAIVVYRGREAGRPRQIRNAVLALAAFMVLTCTGIMTNIRIRRAEDATEPMARLKENLPPGQRLVSFGHVRSKFAFDYGLPISPLPSQPSACDLPAEETVYFCFDAYGSNRPALPFPWEELAVIAMDRNHHATPEESVVVGRFRRIRSD
jgi:4-amino-4-deoxy-L-arabinose transferase-like glycosyltransferase